MNNETNVNAIVNQKKPKKSSNYESKRMSLNDANFKKLSNV